MVMNIEIIILFMNLFIFIFIFEVELIYIIVFKLEVLIDDFIFLMLSEILIIVIEFL